MFVSASNRDFQWKETDTIYTFKAGVPRQIPERAIPQAVEEGITRA